MLVAGADEAGRGAILGPLVIAGVSAPENIIKTFADIGVRDSKRLSPDEREFLYGEIRSLGTKVCVIKVPPSKIDEYVFRRRKLEKLNLLEAETMASIIRRLKVERAYVDSCDINSRRFGKLIGRLAGNGVRIHSYHKADERYPVVSAASIIAKVTRDRQISRLKRLHGDLGTGYPSDPKTVAFLKGWVESRSTFPSFSRKSWKTWDRLEPTMDRFLREEATQP